MKTKMLSNKIWLLFLILSMVSLNYNMQLLLFTKI